MKRWTWIWVEIKQWFAVLEKICSCEAYFIILTFTKGVNADKKCFLMNKIELSFFECYRCVCWGWVGWWYFLSTEQTEIDKL